MLMRVRPGSIAVFAVLLLSCSQPPASHDTTKTDNTSASVLLFEDLGTYHRAVTTSNEMAQKYFDQGLRLLYGFNHDEAERAFREAVRLDPNCGMAWWGAAYVLGPNYNLPMNPERNAMALEAVQKAQSVQSGANETEKGFIAAIATRYSADPKADRAALDHAFSQAMQQLSRRYPEDNDAAVIYAESLMDLRPWQLWTKDGKPQEGTGEILKVLEGVLSRDPNNPGANHYYIHAIEASPTPEKGSASAERLRFLVPGAGHLVHMPAHIYIRTGDYSGAIDANAKAARADEAYFARTKAAGVYPMMYYTHNFQFLSAAAGMLGQSAKAVESAAKAVTLVAPMAGHDPIAEYVLPWSLYAMARSAKWDTILTYPPPLDSTPVTMAMWRYARGLAYLGKSNVSAARKEREGFQTAKAKVPADFMLNTNRAHDLLSIATSVFDGRLASATGDTKSAIQHWKAAIEVQDRLIYDEPPAWYYPVRESLGGEYLRSKEYAEAEKVFRRDLEINPNNPRSLFGVAEALRGQSKKTQSEEFSLHFEKVWLNADVQISVGSL
jgi:tetratricopeptide (TPR) repeat protein